MAAIPPDLFLLGKVLSAPDLSLGDEIGLMLYSEPHQSGYEEAPRNCAAFASTGGDGVHFSFLDTGSGISNESPVVMTVPMAYQPNRVVGANLRHFLGLGLHSGYFILEQLQYDSAGMIDELERRVWERELSPTASELLGRLASEFALVAWSGYGEQLKALETAFAGQLDIAG